PVRLPRGMHCHGAPAGAVVRATEQVTPATPAARAAGWGTAPEPDTSPTGDRRSRLTARLTAAACGVPPA
ncbi:hypothetical protein J0H58_33025, partial [bacterium]|nr:hypothetical protein [bacterium]